MSENKPKIRFKGFTEDWEQRKYSELGTTTSGGSLSYDLLDDENGLYSCILYGDLYTQYDCIIKNIIHKTNVRGNTVYKNDILFPQSTTVDAFSLISPACLNENTAETSGVFVIRPNKDIDGNFVSYFTKGNVYQRTKLSKKAQGLTIVHLYYQSIKDETILIPKLCEQNRISSMMIELDNLISIHQRKFELLKQIKKCLLEKMFPNSGDLIPKIRFKEFTTDWEYCKLDNVAEVLTGGDPPIDYIKTKEPIDEYKYPIFSNGLGDNAIWGYAKSYRINVPAITFSSIGSLGSPELRNSFFTPVIRLKVIIPKAKSIDITYLKYNLDLADFLNNSSGIPNINADSVKAIEFMHTTNITEEQKIGIFFLKLDNLITLHQRKFELLKQIKKCLLEKMFPNN